MSYRSLFNGSVFYLSAVFAIFFTCGLIPTCVAAEQSGYQRTEQQYRIPDVVLIDRLGQANSLKTLIASDRIILLNFIFTTCPSICPVASGTFAQFQKKSQSTTDRPLLVSISIDPEHDTPERLKVYAKKFRADSDWLFLTGSLEDIIQVEKAFDAYRGEKMNHEPLTFLHAPRMNNWIRLDGFASSKQLLIEYKKLLEKHDE